jgi:hypothetical protein
MPSVYAPNNAFLTFDIEETPEADPYAKPVKVFANIVNHGGGASKRRIHP